VNAASNDVSVLEVGNQGLVLRDRAPSQGTGPVSVTIRKNLVYVLNAGGTGNIAGFTLTSDGALVPIPSSVRPLSSSAAAAAQISFSPDGESLVVTERATQVIGVYALGKDGVVTGVTSYRSSGATPFGFDFSGRGKLIVSEAFGGAAGASAVSSYRLSRRDALSPVSQSVPTSQTAACWLVVSKDGRFAYAANAGSASITGYAIARDGTLTRIDDGRTGVVSSGATDVAVPKNGKYLYVLTQGAGTVSAFEIQRDGSLTPIAPASGVVGGAAGLAAR
jgi:6-phosphogluconolactonase (cycloisomerase 2 family)